MAVLKINLDNDCKMPEVELGVQDNGQDFIKVANQV